MEDMIPIVGHIRVGIVDDYIDVTSAFAKLLDKKTRVKCVFEVLKNHAKLTGHKL